MISFSVYADESLFSFDQLKNPTTITDLLARFSKFEFSMTEKENENFIRKLQIEINNAGKEKLQGTETDKITIKGSGTDEIPFTQIWFDGEKIVKLIVDNQELPPVMAQDFVDEIFSSALAPFLYFKEYSLEDAENFQTAEVNKRNRNLDEKNVQVTEYEMGNLAEYGLKSGVISIAEFEDFLIIENYKALTLDDIEVNYRLEEIEFK